PSRPQTPQSRSCLQFAWVRWPCRFCWFPFCVSFSFFPLPLFKLSIFSSFALVPLISWLRPLRCIDLRARAPHVALCHHLPRASLSMQSAPILARALCLFPKRHVIG